MTSKLCVDTARMHVSGMSNGGMFIWTRVMERLAATFASAGTGQPLYPWWRVCIKTTSPVCSAPLRGFNPMPDTPISIIDFHGLLDSTIPPSPEAPDNLGPGPDMTTETWDGYYYHIKLDHLAKVSHDLLC